MNDVKATTEAYMEAIKKRVDAAQQAGIYQQNLYIPTTGIRG